MTDNRIGNIPQVRRQPFVLRNGEIMAMTPHQ